MEDITPSLWSEIQKAFNESYNNSDAISGILSKMAEHPTYNLAKEYASEVSSIYSKALQFVLKAEKLPDGKLYFNIANRTITPAMNEIRKLVSEQCLKAQQYINDMAGLSIRAIQSKPDVSMVRNLIDRVSENNDKGQNLEETEFLFGENTLDGFGQSVVSDNLKANAEWAEDAGFVATVRRYSTSRCCDWCESMLGTYRMDNAPDDIWKVHDNCTCEFDYRVGRKASRVRFEYSTDSDGRRRITQVTT